MYLTSLPSCPPSVYALSCLALSVFYLGTGRRPRSRSWSIWRPVLVPGLVLALVPGLVLVLVLDLVLVPGLVVVPGSDVIG